MMTIEAPYPDVSAYMELPNPDLRNARGETSTVIIKRSMANTIHTYANRRTGRQIFRLSMTVTRKKALEYLAFMQLFLGSKMKFDFLGSVKIGYLTNNPVELEMVRRALHCDSVEEVPLDLVLETTE